MKAFSVRLYCPGLFTGYGGAEKYTAMLAQFLADKYDHLDISFVVYGNVADGVQPIRLLNEQYALSLPEGMKAIFLKEGSSGILSKFISQHRLRSTSNNIDLFINCFHNVHFFHARKNVHIVHFPARRRVDASPLFSRNAILKPIGAILDHLYKHCYDLFICNSDFTRKWLGKYWGIDPCRSVVIYPPTGRALECVDVQVDKKKKTILMVSRFDPRKNLFEAVEYFVRNEDSFSGWSLVVAGSLSESGSNYHKQIARVAAGHRVELCCNPSAQELDELYRSAGIFWHAMGLSADENVNPIDIEHFGITTVEAMAYGAVPVVIDKGGQQEIVDDGINGFKWTTLKTLGDATRSLIADSKLRNKLAKAAIEKSKNYSSEEFYRCSSSVFEIFELIPKEYCKV
jgi:glycosyltransferase involved in cell wall biosynthesis